MNLQSLIYSAKLKHSEMAVLNMVEIIPERNPDIDKNLFLKELSEKSGGITLKIIRISDAIASNRNKKDDFIYIDFLIIDEFKGKLILNDDRTVKNETIDVTNDIIGIPFTLNELDETKNYTIGRNKNIFNILNYAMKKQKIIPINNNSSIRCTYDEIKSALINLTFNSTAKLIKSKDFNDYYRLEVL